MNKSIIKITGETSADDLMEYIEEAYEEIDVKADTLLKITIEKISEEEYDNEDEYYNQINGDTVDIGLQTEHPKDVDYNQKGIVDSFEEDALLGKDTFSKRYTKQH